MSARRRSTAPLVVGFLIGLPSASWSRQGPGPEDASIVLEVEVRPGAIRELAHARSGLGVSTLLDVLDAAGPDERRIIAESFRGELAQQERVLDALRGLARDDALPVREAAIRSLERAKSYPAATRLLSLVEAGHPDRDVLLRSVRTIAESLHSDDNRERENARRERSLFEEHASRTLAHLLDDPSLSVRQVAVEIVRTLSHPSAPDLLLASLDDADENVRKRALKGLCERKEKGRLATLLDYAGSLEPGAGRREAHGAIGYYYCGSEALRFFEILSAATDPAPKEDVRAILDECRLPFASEVQRGLQKYENDGDPEIRERARKFLTWIQKERAAAPSRSVAPLSVLLVSAVTSACLGLILFLWAFRLLKLRALLVGIGVSRARSVALGTVAVSGDAHPRGDYLRHPCTGEICVWYPGAEKNHPDHAFYVEDETGRLLVDPRGAVLLSEDGIITPGERIHVVATAKMRPDAGPSSDKWHRVLVGKSETARPFHTRVANLLVSGVLGAVAGNRSMRRLFENPEDVFWIWDDARERPMSSPREVALVFGVALLAGAWMVIFFVSTAVALGLRPLT